MEVSTHTFPAKRGPRPRVVGRVAKAIQTRLATGVYPPNTYLPSERQLAEDLHVGRQSIAAAIRNLSELGLVERHPGRGSYIKRVDQCISILHTVFPGSSIVWSEATCILQGARDRLAASSLTVEEINRLKWQRDSSLLGENVAAALFLEVDEHIRSAVHGLIDRGIPCVVANLEQDFPELPSSFIDHGGVVRQATQLLIDMGHRRIGYIGNEPQVCFYANTLNGYTQSLRDAGIEVDPQLIELRSGTMALAGYLGARALLQQACPPTAIVAARDGYAEGICMAANEAGLVVGRDLSVIGYDNLTWSEGQEFLTTFAHPGAKLGDVAGTMLLEWILSGEKPASRKVDAPIIMRRSVGPAPV
jgi:DNA-binding LacI/PurR family transcriptional regulator